MEKNMEWTQFLVLFITLIGFLWISRVDAKKNEESVAQLRRDMIDVMHSIDKEMKDFHGRLERQDAEFRTRLCNIEEKYRSKQ